MQFRPELCEQIRLGQKTQTRRVVKPNEDLIGWMPGTRFAKCVAKLIDGKPSRIKWQVDKSYAVCPGRTKKAVGRMWIKAIRHQEDVRLINPEDARAEGFESVNEFLSTWMHINDHSAQAAWVNLEHRKEWIWYTNRRWHHSSFGDDFAAYLASRPAERYNAWVIEFEKDFAADAVKLMEAI
jgi:hypothetical protein